MSSRSSHTRQNGINTELPLNSAVKPFGYGVRHFKLAVYLENAPVLEELKPEANLKALTAGDVSRIVTQTSNHWRKIFNLFAKLQFGLTKHNSVSWQDYRDQHLLQAHCDHALLFSPPVYTPKKHRPVSIISGKTYAAKLRVLQTCEDVGDGFYRNKKTNLFVTPYFDYRQLSNAKLERLIKLIQQDA